MRSSTAACASSPRPWPARGSPATGAREARRAARRGEGLGAGAQLGAVAEGQPRGALGVAEAQARAGLRRRRLDPVQAGGDLVGARRVEAHVLAARSDGGQDLARAVGEEHEVREGGGLLERLEHPVGGLVVHRLGALDDEDAPARLERRPGGAATTGSSMSETSISARRSASPT
jgi:hypothetical protein